METASMYDENTAMHGGNLKQLKSKMTLDFNGSKIKKMPGLLSSPDLNIMLNSPELERIIIQQSHGNVTATPTPTQFLFPKAVTEDQQAYAQGFLDALDELKSQEKTTNDEMPISTSDTSSTMTTLMPVASIQPETTAVSVALSQHQQHIPMQSVPMFSSGAYTFTTTTSLPGNSVHMNHAAAAPMPTMVQHEMMDLSRNSSPSPLMHQPPHQPQQSRVLQLKEEPQTVPCYNTPPISPINMESQERIKVDRKRARNRVAARKCRYRKLERISKLEDRVRELQGHNKDLGGKASQLREQVAALKQTIMQHVNSGCKVMLSPSAAV